jgi:hypothetical protein
MSFASALAVRRFGAGFGVGLAGKTRALGVNGTRRIPDLANGLRRSYADVPSSSPSPSPSPPPPASTHPPTPSFTQAPPPSTPPPTHTFTDPAKPSQKRRTLPRPRSRLPAVLILAWLGITGWGAFYTYVTNREKMSSSVVKGILRTLRGLEGELPEEEDGAVAAKEVGAGAGGGWGWWSSSSSSSLSSTASSASTSSPPTDEPLMTERAVRKALHENIGLFIRPEPAWWLNGDPHIEGNIMMLQGHVDLCMRIRGSNGMSFFRFLNGFHGTDPYTSSRSRLRNTLLYIHTKRKRLSFRNP